MKKVGRPPLYLYEDDRINTRREQNRNNQRNCRLKKKLHKQVRDITQPINFNKKYQEDIVNSFKNYGFNTLFTGTINLNHLEQDELEVMNKEVDKMNQELQIELNHFKERRTTIQSLKDYTERYIQFLYSRNVIDRSLVFFEIGDNQNIHTHIILNSKTNYQDLKLILESGWLIGVSKTSEPISNNEEKEKVIRYGVKELKPTSSKSNEQKKIDNWFFIGEYD
ncbi:MAG: hypothetical protein IM571_01675 [Chitinophagaceae bacterium]|jgi:hypothetical protein|nr:hypothetical protein [Chitinophagaceae bacterium]MCA6468972.1 hypothetical protein [Chitinophagaceae bacterium]MCA6476636.1 hypothetical protein [Chitinophagaceae bacterium]MCA6479062.1 hypothetical protein [Chitinophagaceae bacterium]